MKQLHVLAVLAGLLLVTGIAVADTHTDQLMAADHPLYEAKMAGETGVENLAADDMDEAEAKVNHADKRADEADQLAQDDQSDLAADTAEAYSDKMQEVNDLGDRISDLAQKQEFDELVAEATQHHADVLSQVHERVPEEAQDRIGAALDSAVQGHDRAVNAMADRGQPTDQFDMADRIPDNVADQAGIDLDTVGQPNAGPDNGANGAN